MAQATDEAILDWAQAQQRVCVTLDADFHALIAVHARKSPSVVRIRIEGLKADELAALLQRLWARFESALDKGALVTATPSSVRVRHLPIERQALA
jgi:predicted nuclease of predicted toxin-antitoxin system